MVKRNRIAAMVKRKRNVSICSSSSSSAEEENDNREVGLSDRKEQDAGGGTMERE